MSWGLTMALCVAALMALANATRRSLSRLHAFEERVMDGRGLSPSLLLAVHQRQGG